MSLYIDSKYVSLISPKLERFARKSEYLWNFRCPICGDSTKNKLKTRGYIFRRKSDLFFMCHNCNTSISFGNFLKSIDKPLYKEYQLERFKNESSGNVAKPDFSMYKTKPDFTSKKITIDLPKISDLEDNHSAKVYLKKRKIPSDRLSSLYYANDFAQFVKSIIPDYDKNLKSEDPRIVIPFYDEDNILLGFQGRALLSSSIKYITIKLNDDYHKLFGLDKLDKTKTVYVVEGPVDSMFIQNSVATMDASLYTIIQTLGNLDYVFIYDNEPRNKDVCRNIEKTIALGKKVVIWPKNIQSKDINDMILSNVTSSEIQRIIDSNTFSEHRAQLEFQMWKKV